MAAMERVTMNLMTATITPTCRANRGHDGAWLEAVRRLREAYDVQVQRHGDKALVVYLNLSIERDAKPQGSP